MDIKKLVRQNILNLKPYTSARDLYNDPGYVMLDANENNFGSTFNEIPEIKLNRYPDPRQNDIRELVGKAYGLDKEQLFFGVGSDEIIDLLIRIFCEPGKDNVIIPEPTFGMYKVFCDVNNVKTKTVLLKDDFQLDINAVKNEYDNNTKIIFLCSPNNPTGNLLKKEDIFNLCKDLNSIIIVDEAYIDFAGSFSLLNEINNFPNLLILRTFSKAWGLAGARLGFSISTSEITELLFKIKSPCNVSTLTRYAIINAFKNSTKKDEYCISIIKERNKFTQLLNNIQGIIKIYPSDSNFILIKVKNSKVFQQKLAEKGILVRDRSGQPKLENCVRISIGTEEENKLLYKTIKEVL